MRTSSIAPQANALETRTQKRRGGIGRALRFGINAFWIGGLLFIMSGQYGRAVEWKDSRVMVVVSPNAEVQRLAANLGREDFRQINCLARNLYFEAGNQGLEGMWAVANVVRNRLHSGLYPGSICQIIDEGPTDAQGELLPFRCQFTWRCDGLRHEVRDKQAWDLAYNVAYSSYLYSDRMPDITDGALRYHATYVSPKWKGYRETVQIGLHKFFKPAG